MDTIFDLMLFRVIYTPLICCIIHTLGVEASRISRGVKCRQEEYYSIPAEGCISCHVPCDNAIMKKSQDVCNMFCPDFTKPLKHTPEVITGSVQADLSWIAGPIAGGFLTLILVIVLVIYCRRHSRFGIGKHYRGSNGQRNVADPVHDEELQILDPHHGPGPHLGNPTVGSADSGGRHLVSVHCPSENHHNPSGLNNVPHNPVSDHPPKFLYPFPKSKSLQDHAHHFHHPNQFCPGASQPFHCSTSTDNPNDSIRGPIPYASEPDYRVVEEECDTVVMKPVVESQAAQNGMNFQVVSGESQSLQNDNNYITQPHCSMDGNSTGRRVIEVQESLVRAEVSRSIPHSSSPNSRSQVYYNGNTSSVNEHYQCQPDLTGVTSNTFHAAVTEHSVHAIHEFLASPNIACFPITIPTSISIPVIVEHPEGDPDNLEWQEQQHRASQDQRCIHQPALGINKHEEKEVSMDRQKYIVSNL